jgi:hypothetical protein
MGDKDIKRYGSVKEELLPKFVSDYLPKI